MTQFPILSAILWLPLIGAVGAVLLPRVAGWGWALLTALADLALCLVLIAQFSSSTAGFQFVEHVDWLPAVGIIALGALASNTFHIAYNLDLSALTGAHVTSLARDVQIPLFLAFAAAFAVKSGLFPLHSWVPDTYSEAPVPVVVLVAGVMAK